MNLEYMDFSLRSLNLCVSFTCCHLFIIPVIMSDRVWSLLLLLQTVSGDVIDEKAPPTCRHGLRPSWC